MVVEFKNDFHNTSARVHPKLVGGVWAISKRQYAGLRRKLCPSYDCCSCGVVRGGRFGLQSTGQDYEVYFQGARMMG